ncbi:MAG: dipeptidase [Gemmatimonadaceae bacterium]
MAAPHVSRIAGVSDRALRVYREAFVIDMHNDMPSKMLDEAYDPDVRHTPAEGRTDLPRLKESGLAAVFFAAWVDAPFALEHPDGSFRRALRYMETIRAFVARHPGALRFGTSAQDVRRAREAGAIAVFIGVEGGHAIEADLGKLHELFRLGARYLTLTWNNGNQWAGSSLGSHETSTGGLTSFGRDVIRELDRLGMMVDVSHVSDETFADVLAVSTAPVIATHSSARALADHPRNLTDDQLRAIAGTGGVVNVNFFSRFIDARFRKAMDDVDAEVQALADAERARGMDAAAVARNQDTRARERIAQLPPTPLAVLIDHIDHIARVAGTDHTGIGSDFDGISASPDQMADVTELPRLAQALLDRGYSESDVTKILGGNMLRVMEQVLTSGR